VFLVLVWSVLMKSNRKRQSFFQNIYLDDVWALFSVVLYVILAKGKVFSTSNLNSNTNWTFNFNFWKFNICDLFVIDRPKNRLLSCLYPEKSSFFPIPNLSVLARVLRRVDSGRSKQLLNAHGAKGTHALCIWMCLVGFIYYCCVPCAAAGRADKLESESESDL